MCGGGRGGKGAKSTGSTMGSQWVRLTTEASGTVVSEVDTKVVG